MNLKRYDIAQAILNKLKGRLYLEIGVNKANSFKRIVVEKKIGVDPLPTYNFINLLMQNADIHYFSCTTDRSGSAQIKFNLKNKKNISKITNSASCELFYVISDVFFENYASPVFRQNRIDVAFIDGLHAYKQVVKDVGNTLRYLEKGGVILIHDCNPPTEAAAYPAKSWKAASKMNIEGWTGQWCGDVWKSIVHLRAVRNDLEIFVLDCDYGIGVVRQGQNKDPINMSIEEIEKMTYAEFNSNRKEMLNLKHQDYLYDFLEKISK
ncbi:hypothetical protein Dvar_39820 [Desulfosarcina variabilis str. Montpellier]|uniref:class I SAM-dependent methyltransferase n=1 Tax=Desulfosarcina variabilis TaxID=2300 RepID=UPI003AFA7924